MLSLGTDLSQCNHSYETCDATELVKYRENIRTSYTNSQGRGAGGGYFSGRTIIESRSGKVRENKLEDPRSWNESGADFEGTGDPWAESESEGQIESSVLIPVMGKELAHVQFRSLEEQLFRAMAALFDQQERHSVTRLIRMSAPISIKTPSVYPVPASRDGTKRFLESRHQRLPFSLLATNAHMWHTSRSERFVASLFKNTIRESTVPKRRIK